MPKISVIIPTYNYGKYIEKAIDSVLTQTYRDFEIIVVDDGSTDNTREIIETKYKDKVRYFYQENKGAPAARNKGIEESRGAYLVFLDADDWFASENLEKNVTILENKPEIRWVYSDLILTDVQMNFIGKASDIFGIDHNKMNLNVFKSLLLGGNFIPTSVALIAKKSLLEVNGFDETLQVFQDYDLFLRLSKKFPPKFINEPLVFHRMHPKSITSRIFKTFEARLIIIDKIRSSFPEESKKYKKELIKKEADVYNYLGILCLKNNSKIKSLLYFLKSIYRRPLQKKAYELILRIGFRNDVGEMIHDPSYTIWKLYKK